MTKAFITSAARTPVGSFLGQFKTLAAPDLGAVAVREVVSRSGFSAESIDEVIMGQVLTAGAGQAPARQAALCGGLPATIPALTINKVCGSGLKAVMLASAAIRCGDASRIIAGGMESMSTAPHLLRGFREGQKLGNTSLVDSMVNDGLTCSFNDCHMGMHAEHTASSCNVSREDQDRFAVQSQQRAAKAQADGIFSQEIVSVTVPHRKGDVVCDTDEGPRGDTTLETLQGLRTVFQKDGTVTAGNASTINDGAAAVVVCDEASAESADFKLEILASHTSGTDPQDLFIAPVEAVKKAVEKAGLQMGDIDLFEINEAFASQSVACQRQLGIDDDRLNIYGGGISLGHPIGASGARVLVTLFYALKRTGKQHGVASLCLGGGNAVAMVVKAHGSGVG